MPLTIASWNINGIRSISKKGDLDMFITDYKPDILALQEIRCDDPCAAALIEEKYKDTYPYIFFNTSLFKKGYAGTAILSKIQPNMVSYNIPAKFEPSVANGEGRLITVFFKDFTIINVYTPNSGSDLKRLNYRTQTWDVAFKDYIASFTTPIIVCGDLNVAHHDIDIHSPKTNQKTAGFTLSERKSFDNILADTGLVDSFRHMYPTKVKYSYWSNFNKSREKNKGWRIDYILYNGFTLENVNILDHVPGSDHAPVIATFKH